MIHSQLAIFVGKLYKKWLTLLQYTLLPMYKTADLTEHFDTTFISLEQSNFDVMSKRAYVLLCWNGQTYWPNLNKQTNTNYNV